MKSGRGYPRGYRVASLVRRGLSPMLNVAHADVTIRNVSLNGDFSVATIYYSVLGGDPDSVRLSLTRNAAFFRRRLASFLNMRSTPKLVFAPDTEGMAADDMQNFLDSIEADDARGCDN